MTERLKWVERTLQAGIILACLLILGSKILTFPINAEIECGGQPPIRNNSFPNSFEALRANSWLPGASSLSKRQINFVIYDTNDSQAAYMEKGVRAWNDNTDCAYVYFKEATRGTNPSGNPGADTLWIFRGSNTQGFPVTNLDNQMIAFKISILAGWNQHPESLLVVLSSHEAGHSFGFLNAPPRIR